jgi:hypothetical protein
MAGPLRSTEVTPPRRLYEAPRVKRLFGDQHFFFPSVSRGSRERKSALMAWTALCLGRDERSSPEARRVAPLAARGLEGEGAAQR